MSARHLVLPWVLGPQRQIRHSPCPCEIHSLEGERNSTQQQCGGSLLCWRSIHSFSWYYQMPGYPTRTLIWSHSCEASSLARKTTSWGSQIIEGAQPWFLTVKWGNVSPQGPLGSVASPPFGAIQGKVQGGPCFAQWHRGNNHLAETGPSPLASLSLWVFAKRGRC